jgi:hypothetical protein
VVRYRSALYLVLLSGVGCMGDPPLDSPRNGTSVAGATVETPAPTTPPPTAVPTATATATATPRPTTSPIAYVRVAFFGVNCKGGGAPDNAERKLPVGCSGDVTATPKKEDGTDVDSEVHGPDISWDLVHGEQLVDVYTVPGQAFNRHLIGRVPGPFMLCATVKGVMGCLTGEVTR